MKRFAFVLMIVVLLAAVSCRSSSMQEPEIKQEEPQPAPESWAPPAASAGTLTEDEWNRLFPPQPEKTEEPAGEEAQEESLPEPEKTVSPEVVPIIIDEPETEEPVVEEETGEPSFILDDEPVIEVSFDIGPDDEVEISQAPAEIEFAGEEEPSWSWLDTSEASAEPAPITEITEVVPEVIENSGWVEDVNPDIVSAIAQDYENLHDGISAKPAFSDRIRNFLREYLLWIYGTVGVLILAVVIIAAVISAKKRIANAPKREEDEGEEIVTDFGAPRPDAQYYRSPLSDPVPEEKSEDSEDTPAGSQEEPGEQEYDDGF